MGQRQVGPELAAPFLEAKVQLPEPSRTTVRRQRLLDLLDRGNTCELTVVSGPPGSGKTTLLADWIHADPATGEPRPAAWLALDYFDNDPVQFWTGVVASLAAIPNSVLAAEAGRLAGLTRSDARTLLSELGEALAAAPERPTLVLDDYHIITSQPIHEGVQLAIRYLAARVRLVLATRTSPPLGLGRLRARGRLSELRFDDLRFTAEEGERLLSTANGKATDRSRAEALTEASDGWAAALYVAAIAQHTDGLRPGTVTSGTLAGGHLSEYLVEEVLADQPEPRRRFLLETSILDPLTPARCQAVTGFDDSAQVLHELERSSQFVRRRDQDGRWYSYHALLRDLLQAELVVQGFPIDDLHRRASAAAEREEDAVAAIHHAAEAGDDNRVSALIGRWWIDFTNRGRFATVMAWIDRWSALTAGMEPAPDQDPTIFVVAAWTALHTGRLHEVEGWLARAEACRDDGPLPDGTASVASAISIVRNSWLRRIGSVGEAVDVSLPSVEAETDAGSPWRAVALVGRGASLFWAGRDDESRATLEEAVMAGLVSGLNVPVVLGGGHLALLDRRDGLSGDARRRAEQAVGLAVDKHLIGYDQAAAAYLALALCQLDAVELGPAAANLAVALRLAKQGNESLISGAAHLGLADLARLNDQPDQAERELTAAETILATCADPGVFGQMVETARQRSRRQRLGAPGAELTPRELVVLAYLGSRLTVPEIARELYVSPNTVKTQVAAIRAKLGAGSRAEAVAEARSRGLLG